MATLAAKAGALGSMDNLRVVCDWVDRLQELLPRATLATPNRAEAKRLGLHIGQTPGMKNQPPLAITGGDAASATGLASDWLQCAQTSGWLSLPRVDTNHHHGTGCTFASTAAAALACGYCVADAVVDSANWVARVLTAGIRTVQLRIKNPADSTLPDQISKAVALARQTSGAQLFINDHWQLALQHGAYGVHLGQEDLETVDLETLRQAGVRLGLSTHSYWEVARAWGLQPSYIACGPIFPTQSKDMPWTHQGLDNLRYWAGLLPLPVVGIGGIGVDNVAAVGATGAASAAVISAITQSPDPEAACRVLGRGRNSDPSRRGEGVKPNGHVGCCIRFVCSGRSER